MKVSIIAAVAENGAIGKDNDLIWHISEDLKFFKRTTSGHHIIMGRKNYESIGRPLPKRTNVVVTRNTDLQIEGCEMVASIEEALALAKSNGDDDAMIIGGGEIYRQSMDLADTFYLTKVHQSFEGDVFFPEVDWSKWRLVMEENHPKTDENPIPYTFCQYEKV